MFKITEGKYKGLMAVSDKKGIIRAAAMDQRGSLRKAIAKEKGVEEKQVTDAMMSEFKVAVSKALTPHASAILLDPEVGLAAVKARAENAGVLLAYEQTGYDHTFSGRVPTLIPDWTVKKAIEAGADCIKVLIYYTPFEDKKINEIKRAFVSRIGAECAYYDIPYFLEFVGYDPQGGDEKGVDFAKKKPEIVIKSMQEFSRPEYNVDVLKVEIPVNLPCVEGAQSFKGQKAYSRKEALDFYRQADQSAKKPYIYLSAGVSDDQFRESLELAIEARTHFAGVLCGRATWKDGIPIYAKQGLKAFEAWLADRGVKNITALNQVLDKGARAWWDKYGGKGEIQIVNKSCKTTQPQGTIKIKGNPIVKTIFQITILTVCLNINPQIQIDSFHISRGRHGPSLSFEIAPKLATVNEQLPTIPKNGSRQLVRMTTSPRRLDHSKNAIKSLIEPIQGQAIVYDIGVGWPPVTTEELAEVLGNRSQVIGIDNQLPSYVVITTKEGTVLFDENDQIINWIHDTIKTGDEISEENRARLMSLAKSLKQEALISKNGGYSDIEGNRIILEPIKTHQMGNLNFVKADLFNLTRDLSQMSLPKAHIVRIANLIFLHYGIGDIEKALNALHSVVLENGYILIGRSNFFGPIALDEEEYLVFRKKGDAIIFDSYLFSLRYVSGTFIFGVAYHGSPASHMKVSFDKILREHPSFGKWKTFMMDDNLWPYVIKYGTQARREYDKDLKQFVHDVTVAIAQKLTQEGLKIEVHGSMLKVELANSSSLQNSMAKEFMEAIQAFFLDKGVPKKVEKKDETMLPPDLMNLSSIESML